MGTIIPRPRKDGTTAYLAQVTIKRDRVIVHRESRTFDREQAARSWIKMREKQAATEEGLAALTAEHPTLKQAINKYVESSLKEIGKTKAQVLKTISETDLAAKRCDEIKSSDIVEYGTELLKTVQPQTVGNYMSHLAAVYAVARPAWGMPLEPTVMADATIVMKRLGIISKSRERDRRPTLEELDKLMRHFEEVSRRRPTSNPMTKIIAFAIFSTRRQEEITLLAWADLDEEHSRVLVRDMKHPGQKVGNDIWCDLPPEALQIAQSMPRTSGRIFPYNTDAISAAFTRACQLLEIEDLHFHDLRHDGVSRLFEMGMTIPQAASVSGHRSWNSLKRYAHLRSKGDRYVGWPWLAKLIAE